jgi:2-methylcitrate dehydratase PrpD
MKALAKVAAFVQRADLDRMPAERLDRIKRHVIDTWGAQVAGSRVDGTAVSHEIGIGDASLSTIVTRCAQARCTEIDDIHLGSCTTPGSVVVPAALALASIRDRNGKPIRVRDFCAAVLAGYETLIRAGEAIDGPAALHRGVWPTAFAAAFGSAALASRLFGSTADQTRSALATALVFAQHRAVASSPPRSTRWLTLGVAAASGVTAAYSARDGLVGAMDPHGLSDRLTRGLGRQYLFDDIGMKRYPTARQGFAAIEAVRDVVGANRLRASDITSIAVGLPKAQRLIVDRRGFPASRFESIVDVRYQIALALVAPERLHDIARTPPFENVALRRLMAKIRVGRARDLERYYPRCWPARVEIRTRGRRYARVLLYPPGDARRPLGWDDIRAKLQAIAGPIVGVGVLERLVGTWRDADVDAIMPAFP